MTDIKDKLWKLYRDLPPIDPNLEIQERLEAIINEMDKSNTYLDQVGNLDHDMLVKSINDIDRVGDRQVTDLEVYSSVKSGVSALSFLHDLYHEIMRDDC